MIRFAVGIPSFNEADNIARLTKQIDLAAQELGIEICIINSDNNSPDGTAEIFKETKTYSPRVSIITSTKGKGRNVLSIFEYVAKSLDIEFCFLVDADIVSFEKKWLEGQYAKYKEGLDYVLPQYKRKYIEGNATNHFSYPMMYCLLDGPAPRQPIAGDIGLSKRLIEFILKQPLNEATYGYGIDMFISVNSLYFDGTISEVPLNQKLHKPSFSKMIRIFQEETSSFYFARQGQKTIKAKFINPAADSKFLNCSRISDADLKKRFREAKTLYSTSNKIISDGHKYFQKEFISEQEWANILVQHEKLLHKYSADGLSQSLTPYYLLRAVSYLKTANSPEQAQDIVNRQNKLIHAAMRDTIKK